MFIPVNQNLRHNLGYTKIQAIQCNQVYFSSSNVTTDTAVFIKDLMLNGKSTFCFKITIKWKVLHILLRILSIFILYCFMFFEITLLLCISVNL